MLPSSSDIHKAWQAVQCIKDCSTDHTSMCYEQRFYKISVHFEKAAFYNGPALAHQYNKRCT
jgi:hypothetical protein